MINYELKRNVYSNGFPMGIYLHFFRWLYGRGLGGLERVGELTKGQRFSVGHGVSSSRFSPRPCGEQGNNTATPCGSDQSHCFSCHLSTHFIAYGSSPTFFSVRPPTARIPPKYCPLFACFFAGNPNRKNRIRLKIHFTRFFPYAIVCFNFEFSRADVELR